MEHLEYQVVIAAKPEKVWDTMLDKETYKQWVAKSWPESFYDGEWAKGKSIRFIGPDGSGMLAEVVELNPFENVFLRHVAVLGAGGKEDRTSDLAKSLVGTTEEYTFAEHAGKTTVSVSIWTKPEWREMFDDGWPGALEELKKVSEGQVATV